MAMFKIKNILITATVITIIGMVAFIVYVYQKIYSPIEVVKTEIPELVSTETKESPEMKYKIISVGTWQEELIWARYHIFVENVLVDEEQIKILSENIIKDIMTEDSKLEKIELLFYYDEKIACQTEYINAKAIWTPDEFSVKILHASQQSPLGTAVSP